MIPDRRLGALRRFAVAITVLNILGHTFLGFEQSWAHPLVALATAYALELLIETVEARAQRRRPRFAGGFKPLVTFLLPAHISALAVAMLLYSGSRLAPTAFAVAVAIASKTVFRVPVGRGKRHFFNPSNLGIAVTLLLFPWVGIAPPYQFTENLSGGWDWVLPGIIVASGTFLNARFTRRIPLIVSWLTTFALQAAARALILGGPWAAGFVPMTGVAFVLFTYYMVTDPATTPEGRRGQIFFGASVALTYGVLTAFGVVFGLFFGLGLVCLVRGSYLWAVARQRAGAPASAAAATQKLRHEERGGSPAGVPVLAVQELGVENSRRGLHE